LDPVEMVPDDVKLIDRIAAMLWTFDGAEPVPDADRERERGAYRARARILVRIVNEHTKVHGVQQPNP
jgi:hypothetical protein